MSKKRGLIELINERSKHVNTTRENGERLSAMAIDLVKRYNNSMNGKSQIIGQVARISMRTEIERQR